MGVRERMIEVEAGEAEELRETLADVIDSAEKLISVAEVEPGKLVCPKEFLEPIKNLREVVREAAKRNYYS